MELTELKKILNPSILSLDSVQGLIVALLLIAIVAMLALRIYKVAKWCAITILLMQAFYIMGQIPAVNAIIPLSKVFKYDVLTALAQICVGSKLSELLLLTGDYMSRGIMWFVNLVGSLFGGERAAWKDLLPLK